MTKQTNASLITALLFAVAPATLAAQGTTGQTSPTQPTQASEPADMARFANAIDFGARISTVDGDPARWQRYRDMRDGPVINRFDLRWDRNNWLLGVSGDHVGYRDQRYLFEAERPGRLSARFLYDQIPLFISEDTRTLYTNEGGGALRIGDDIQSGIQNGTLTIRQAADRAFGVDTRTRRDNAVGELMFRVTPSTDAFFNVTTSNRNGSIPFGATFGFNNAIEVPLPIDQRTTNVGTGVEWANQNAMVRASWDGSWFTQNVPALVWDNPLRISDATTGPAQGRMALWPSNTFHTLSSAGSVKLPARSRLVATAAMGWARQNEPLVPNTINTAIGNPSLPRGSAEAAGQMTSTYLALTSRPMNRLMLQARHRFYRFDNDTEEFHRTGTVSYDTTTRLEETEPLFYSVSRSNLDLDATVTFGPAAWKVGYGLIGGERTARHWETTTEHAFRTSVDVVGQGPYSVRALYEHSRRSGDDLDLHPLEEAGEQPSMRHFDIADRRRHRTSLILTAAPSTLFDVIGSLAIGSDDFTEEMSGQGLGLRDNAHRIYSVGINVAPRDSIGTGISYSFEEYDAFLNQRQATSLAQAFDSAPRWDMDTDDRAHNVLAHLDLPQLIENTDVRFVYDFSNSRTTFVYSLPPGSTLTQPQQLPPVRHSEHRAEIGVIRQVTQHWALGADYWFHTYDVEDFALGGDIDQGIAFPPVQPGVSPAVTTVLLNYLYRPFTGHTGIFRAIYRFDF
jgi:MtrB/PioB family decaheme-associated outer membrane protein